MSIEHHHNHTNTAGTKLALSILLNILISLSQVIGGLISGSLSLLSDALHNFGDVISLSISYIANRLARRKYTIKETFGYKRAEIIAAFINAATLIAIAIFLTKEAIVRFREPEIINSGIVILLAISSIIINTVCVLLLRGETKDSINIKSSYLHLLTDVVTSFAVLAGGLAMRYLSVFWIDSLLSIIIAIYLIISSWKLFIQSIRILMQFTPPNIHIEDLSIEISGIEGIKNIHHIHVWQLDDKSIHFECHIDFSDNITLKEFETKLEKIKNILNNKGIKHYNIQPEFESADSKKLIVQE